MNKQIVKRIFFGFGVSILAVMLLLAVVFFSLMFLENNDPRKVEEETGEEEAGDYRVPPFKEVIY